MKILVLGANGMAGHSISLYFKEQGHDVTGFTLQAFDLVKNIVGDALDKEQLKRILQEGSYDLVVNCIGLLNQVADTHPSLAVYLNSFLPQYVVDVLNDFPTKFIQMSTDCVFAGNTGPYVENALQDGRSMYDRSKALGEVNDSKNLTFRNSIVGPDLSEKGIGLFNWFMKQKGEINGYTKAFWTGVTTLTLAKAMEKAAEENITGIYNLVNNSNISKCNLLRLFNTYFRDDALIIHENDTLALDKSLICTRKDFSFVIPSYEEQIMEMKEWIYAHKHLYPHYFKS